MYKQILLNEAQIDLQRFVYRFSEKDAIKDYRLKTVTFGMANAPYIAVRVLKRLAEIVRDKYPLASNIITSCMYMDDVMGGCHTVEELLRAYDQLKLAFESANLNLRKWCSNARELIDHMPSVDRELKALTSNVKTRHQLVSE